MSLWRPYSNHHTCEEINVGKIMLSECWLMENATHLPTAHTSFEFPPRPPFSMTYLTNTKQKYMLALPQWCILNRFAQKFKIRDLYYCHSAAAQEGGSI